MAAFLIVVVAREWDVWVGSAILQTTDDAYLRADITPLATKSLGYVRSVPVQDFQMVKAGDLLVEIVDDDYRAQVEQDQANVDAVQNYHAKECALLSKRGWWPQLNGPRQPKRATSPSKAVVALSVPTVNLPFVKFIIPLGRR